MNVLLGVLAVLLGLLAAGVLAIVWLFKFRIKRWYLYGLAAAINKFPGRLRLRREESFHWTKAERAGQRVADFQALGFEDLAGFVIDELPKARLFALRHPATGLVGLVNEADELGTWSDVLLFREHETQPVLASSILKRPHFYLLPGDPKIHKPDATVNELIDAIRAAAGADATAQTITADDFAKIFETAYANAVDARLLTPLEDYEIRRLAKERGQPCSDEITDKEFLAIKELLPLAIDNELRLTCGSQFLRETTLAASEWQHATQRLLIIHDRTPLRRLAGKLIYGAFLTEEMKRRLKRAPRAGLPREGFAKLNAAFPAAVRYKKLGEVTRPVPADIYRAPIERAAA